MSKGSNKQWHGGKGSARRKNENLKAYEDNWDRIFGGKKKNIDIDNRTPQELIRDYYEESQNE